MEEIVLLASPDASTGIGYYGRIKTLGTLYWENTAGLKSAAAIYCASTDVRQSAWCHTISGSPPGDVRK